MQVPTDSVPDPQWDVTAMTHHPEVAEVVELELELVVPPTVDGLHETDPRVRKR